MKSRKTFWDKQIFVQLLGSKIGKKSNILASPTAKGRRMETKIVDL